MPPPSRYGPAISVWQMTTILVLSLNALISIHHGDIWRGSGLVMLPNIWYIESYHRYPSISSDFGMFLDTLFLQIFENIFCVCILKCRWNSWNFHIFPIFEKQLLANVHCIHILKEVKIQQFHRRIGYSSACSFCIPQSFDSVILFD